jgi:hypothetical protein
MDNSTRGPASGRDTVLDAGDERRSDGLDCFVLQARGRTASDRVAVAGERSTVTRRVTPDTTAETDGV